MAKVDEIYRDLVLDIHRNGVWDKGENVRTKYIDGTPAYTKSIFGRQVVFEEGVIPLLTSKFVGNKTALKEMMLFWIHQTVKKEDFDAWNVSVWDEWFLKNDTLGKSYAYQFESRPKREIIKIKRRIKENAQKDTAAPIKKIRSIQKHNVKNEDEICGKIFKSKNHGDFKVLNVKEGNKNNNYIKMCDIQFLTTGYIKTVQKQQITQSREIGDPYHTSVLGIGYLGDHHNFKKKYSEKQMKILHKKWSGMIERCYSKNSKMFSNHGGKGVFVEERWHCFSSFLEDLPYLPQFFIAKSDNFKGWSLDKDYYGSNCYSKETCVFLPKEENVLYQSNSLPVLVTLPNGTKKLFVSQSDVVRNGVLTESSVYKLCSKKVKEVKGYKAELITDKENVYRYKISNNQVTDLINNIRQNPSSRRHMTSFWNDADVQDKALQECAMQTTWNVRNDKLDLILYSRSVDTALGLPFNWIQYWFLLQIMAQSTGLKSGRFTHQMGNIHYYDRHEEDLLNQVKEKSFSQPDFWINPEVKDFFQFSPDDIAISNYTHNGKINYEVAI